MSLNDMNREDLISYLIQFVDAIERSWELSEEEEEFISLHKKIIAELSSDRIYKVSNVEVSSPHSGACVPREYNTRYFSSLNAAKRELRQRVRELSKNPFVALPDEVQEYGLNRGVAPSLVQSIVTNSDIQVPVSGRFKICEVRMLHNRQIVPVQFILTSIRVSPSTYQEGSKRAPQKAAADSHKLPKVIPFGQIQNRNF